MTLLVAHSPETPIHGGAGAPAGMDRSGVLVGGVLNGGKRRRPKTHHKSKKQTRRHHTPRKNKRSHKRKSTHQRKSTHKRKSRRHSRTHSHKRNHTVQHGRGGYSIVPPTNLSQLGIGKYPTYAEVVPHS